MKDELARKILAKTVGWDAETLKEEHYRLQIMSLFKYDNYQQFTNGKQFIESLAIWLKRFSIEERPKIYSFVKENIIFISEREMQQLVSISFEEMIRDKIIENAKEYKTVEHLSTLNGKQKFQYFLRKTLFLGLSDGAHMDYFRRYNNFLSNEQVFMHYDISETKYEGMRNELRKDLQDKYKEIDSSNDDFINFILIDDFSGSGISYIRQESESDVIKWKGKLYKFIKNVILEYADHHKMSIHVILYVATKEAIVNIKENLKKYLDCNELNIPFTVQALQYISKVQLDNDIEEILKRDYLSHNNSEYDTFVDTHYKKGKVEKPYLGFDECALPLILYHNAPNNSFPIIWHTWNKKNTESLFKKEEALFPRIIRHKEN